MIRRERCVRLAGRAPYRSRLGARPDYPGWQRKGQGESGEGNACRFFCCAKDQHWIRYLRQRGRFIISPTGPTPISLLKRLSTKLRTDSASGQLEEVVD